MIVGRWQGQISATPRTGTTSIDQDFGKVKDLHIHRTCPVGRWCKVSEPIHALSLLAASQHILASNGAVSMI